MLNCKEKSSTLHLPHDIYFPGLTDGRIGMIGSADKVFVFTLHFRLPEKLDTAFFGGVTFNSFYFLHNIVVTMWTPPSKREKSRRDVMHFHNKILMMMYLEKWPCWYFMHYPFPKTCWRNSWHLFTQYVTLPCFIWNNVLYTYTVYTVTWTVKYILILKN